MVPKRNCYDNVSLGSEYNLPVSQSNDSALWGWRSLKRKWAAYKCSLTIVDIIPEDGSECLRQNYRSLLTSPFEDHPGHKLRGGLVTHHNIGSLIDCCTRIYERRQCVCVP